MDADWLLPKLYSRILCPNVVIQECAQNSAPNKVRLWATQPPEWLEIRHISELNHSSLSGLDRGERSAIGLALEECADAVLIDEIAGRRAVRDLGLIAIGTIGILAEAATNGWINYEVETIRLLTETNFRVSSEVIELGRRHSNHSISH